MRLSGYGRLGLATALVWALLSPVDARALVWPGAAPCNTTLQACIDAAPVADLLLIDSDGPIAESLAISDSLSLRAASGRAPRFTGTQNVSVTTPASGDVYVRIEGLVFERGRIRATKSTSGLFHLEIARNTLEEALTTGGFPIELNDASAGGRFEFEVVDNDLTLPDASSPGEDPAVAVSASGSPTVSGRIAGNRIGMALFNGNAIDLGVGATAADFEVVGNRITGLGYNAGVSLFVYAPGSSESLIANNLVTGQRDDSGRPGAVAVNASQGSVTAVVANNTLADNETGISIGGNGFEAALDGRVLNNIVVGSLGSGIRIDPPFGAAVSNDHNLLYLNASNAFTPGPSTLTADPLFVGGVDHRLQGLSPAVDSGDDDAATLYGLTADLDGAPRIAYARIDRGAYEYAPEPGSGPGALAAFAALLALGSHRRRRGAAAILLLAAAVLATAPAFAAVFVVNSIGQASDEDPGDNLCTTGFLVAGGTQLECTLRAAIQEANTNGILDEIHFASPFGGTIRPTTALPAITAPVLIDGYTAPGFSSDPPARPRVVLAGGDLVGGSDDGLHLEAGAAGSTIRGLTIQGFPAYGIELALGADGVTIQGCWVGLDSTGTAAEPNGVAGIKVRSDSNVIGTSFQPAGFTGLRNVVSGNSGRGIDVDGSNNVVRGNYLGVTPDGVNALGNGGYGVAVGGDGNAIGDAYTLIFTQRSGNLVSANGIGGIAIIGNDNTVIANDVGGDAALSAVIPNNGPGVFVNGLRNVVGSDDPAVANVVLADGDDAVLLGSSASLTQVTGNLVGVDRTRRNALGTSLEGISMSGSFNEAVGNIVARTVNVGIRAFGDDHSVLGNWVGTNEFGDDFGNPSSASVGIWVVGDSNLIGSGTEGAGNVVGVQYGGLSVSGAGNIVQGNWVGTDASGADLGNRSHGVWVTGSARIGDEAGDPVVASHANEIAYNGGAGIVVSGEGTAAAIRGNRIHDNGGIGIDLIAGGGSVPDGATPNDPGDADEGANRLQNAPQLLQGTLDEVTGDLEIAYRVDTLPANATYDLVVDFYAADPDGEEGAVWLGAEAVPAADAGMLSLAVLSLPGEVSPAGLRVVATATDQGGNTSEFSQPVPEPGPGLAGAAALAVLGALARRRREGRRPPVVC